MAETSSPHRAANLAVDLLGLGHLEPVDMTAEDGRIVITCRSCDLPVPADARRNGTKAMEFRDFPIRGKPVVLRVLRQRWQGLDGSTFYEELPDIDPVRRITARFLEHLQQEAVQRPFADAARINRVEETLVRRVFLDYAREKLSNYNFLMPRVLGMDEKFLRGEYRFVLGDVANKRLLDMRGNRHKRALEDYFDSLEDREYVEVICQDMYDTYRQLGKRYFPNAVPVVDKFHVVRMANEGVEFYRRSINASLSNADRVRLKGERKLLLMRHASATGRAREKLDAWLDARPDLAKAYWLKERFYDIYEEPDRAAAERAYGKWEASIPQEMESYFKAIPIAMKRWRPYIFRHFEHRYTNAYVESLNGLIDQMNRLGRGYDFEVLRAKALLKFGGIKPLVQVMAFNLLGLSREEQRAILDAEIGIGTDLSTLSAALDAGEF